MLTPFPQNEYAAFVEVLKARCEIWDIRGDRDWRRRDEEDGVETELDEVSRKDMIEDVTFRESGSQSSAYSPETAAVSSRDQTVRLPKKYFMLSDDERWNAAVTAALPLDTKDPIPWRSETMLVYGRKVSVPRYLEGVSSWSFEELCESTLGPADYITLASTFHTLILDQVPVLHVSQKNEARRLITLLDALYEARCKLIIRAGSDPDHLFFPETRAFTKSTTEESQPNENDGGDAVYPETLSEVYQDQTSPFRPNVSVYKEDSGSGYDPDEDADFGPVPGKGNEIGRQVDFGMTGSFTGEDERFAYKRASSRLWEMCGARWHARSEPHVSNLSSGHDLTQFEILNKLVLTNGSGGDLCHSRSDDGRVQQPQ
jgi:peroxisome-assembly ATPase